MTGQLSPGQVKAIQWLATVIASLGVIGFGLSFGNVNAAMEPSFGRWSPLVPLGIDIGIAAFTGLDLLMAWLDMRTRWLRLIPWALVAATVYLNVAGETELRYQVAHATMPLLWVVAVEAGAAVLRHLVGLYRRPGERMDRVRPARWLLAPISTLRILRLMVLWEERSYTAALDRWRNRRRGKALLAREYGRFWWRWRAPIDDLLDLKFSTLGYRRAEPVAPADTSSETGPIPAPAPPAPPPAGPAPGARLGQPATNGNGHHPPDGEEPVERVAARVAAQLKAEGRQVTRRLLIAGVQAEGHQLGTKRGGELAKELQ